jgi:predicted site-specific integrase-resolvase
MPQENSASANNDHASHGNIEPLVTAECLAATFQVSVRTVHNWANSGAIPVALRIGKVVRFAMSEVTLALRPDRPRSTQTI